MKNKKLFVSFLIITLLSVFLPVSLVHGEEDAPACGDFDGDSIITVYEDLSGECQTIQEAIDVAVDGDTVQVYEGTYNEVLEITGKSITISGDTSDPSSVVIDPNYLGRGFYVHDVTGDAVVIEGFMIQNGSADGGAGINVYNAGIGVSDCIFTNDDTTGSGGAISIILLGADSYIERSQFYSNRASGAGGAISLSGLGETGSEMILQNNLIYENEAVSHGGAVYVGIGGYASLFNNTFVANKSDKDGGAVYLYGDSADVKVQNNIFYDNQSDDNNNEDGDGGAIYLRNQLVESTITYNDFYTNDFNDIYIRDNYRSAASIDITNQVYNPSFTDLANDDYTLTSDSMLIDLGGDLGESGVTDDITGKVRPVDGDLDEVFAYDMGAYEYGDVVSNEDTEEEVALAQTYCEENGGTYETRTYESGDPYYMCVFADTSECDAEVFYAGLCAIGDSLIVTDNTTGEDDIGNEVSCGNFPDVDSADFTEEQCTAITWVQSERVPPSPLMTTLSAMLGTRLTLWPPQKPALWRVTATEHSNPKIPSTKSKC
ncbi:MAG: LamG domain protein jellyroll fold domain protein [Candidatus Peregrinibacteria bacterium GW2011_GWA2_43_8]|nr:MAG: LamG domain protein jellyroll fold domain protein [Candidatus Peregrinibacteria bacterium GW2011_GWA2_43_8]